MDPVIDDLPHQVALGKHVGRLCVALTATQKAVRPIILEATGVRHARGAILAALLASSSGFSQSVSGAERGKLISAIDGCAQSALGGLEDGTIAAAVLDAMRQVPRDAFVPEDLRPLAREDTPPPIGCSQTIPQPVIVALATDLLDVWSGDTVVEIGAGSGYQAAVLSSPVGRVYSIEIIPKLGERAAGMLKE